MGRTAPAAAPAAAAPAATPAATPAVALAASATAAAATPASAGTARVGPPSTTSSPGARFLVLAGGGRARFRHGRRFLPALTPFVFALGGIGA
eukprot:CAMPEP_0184409340 /NCGR_PEP_ID=MMETSP0738-20130409/4014_1 /TAXON_ID=385413 /ORGANISM="Thalassiosira miniscula, Strain CCMP1093" /LENGTH=92 /DNA_ID=CAMNT_0026767043 /DNA_START=555 /DNA_END=833 /DNA_ORIENTATION=-